MRAQRLAVALVVLAMMVTAAAWSVPEARADEGSSASAETTTAVDVTPELTAQTFADPPATVRPKYRWWMPLAFTDDDELADELEQMKHIGAGGAEVAAFSVEGDRGRSSSFLEKYGWGTSLWAHKVETMLAAAKANGLRLDLTIGPRWPATVPTVTDVNDPAAAQQIIFSSEFHPGGSSRTGGLPTNFDVSPPAGAKKSLVAALVARCTDADCATQEASPRLLDRRSVVDVTAQVDASGKLSYTFPGDEDSTYVLIAFYRTATGQSLSGYTATGRNYVLDTLSEAGARATTQFYDQHVLTPGVQGLIDAIGDADLFEDSLELGGTEKWTDGFVHQWTERRGYSPIKLLPALAGAGSQGITDQPYFDFGDGVGARVRHDYRQTLSDLYIANRLDTLRRWTHRHGMHTRIQPYGVPVDSSEAATHIDVPEGESLAFGQSVGAYSNVQDYKVIATGAHLSGEPVVSDECCAFANSVWGSTAANGTPTSNLQAVYRGFAGGVNQIVWHGFPYLTRGPEGAGPQERWPGMSYGGNNSYSAAFGAKGGPNWSDYRQVNDNVSRMQLVLRQGKPRFDVAVYWHDFGMNGGGNTGYGSNRLIRSSSALAGAGYTYEYLSPATLVSDDAVLRDGRLFPERSAYHAVVLANQSTLPVPAARKLLQLAQAGLPVFVVGTPPSRVPGLDASDQNTTLRGLVAQLMRQGSVHQVADEAGLPEALERAGVTPAAAHDEQSSAILDVRRHTESVDYYYLYNRTQRTAAQTLTLRGHGIPYKLNTWTGKITPIRTFHSGHGTVTVPVRLAANDAEVIALTTRRDATFHGPATPPGGGDSDDAHRATPVALDNWSLTVDSWSPGASDLPGDTAHTTLGPVRLRSKSGELPPWSEISPQNDYAVDLRDVSGVGTYTTHVSLGDDWNSVRGAYLDLGSPPVDTVRVSVNGHELPPLDQADLGHIDVGQYLRPDENTIKVRVASTLLNAVRVAPGTGASGRARMDYGLFGPVTLIPYAGARPYLTAEPLARSLPLADGGFNRADVLITNHSPRAVRVELAASVPAGIDAEVPSEVTVEANRSRVVSVRLRNGGLDHGESTLELTADAENGAQAVAQVSLHHSDDLARNVSGAPYPHAIGAASQDRYPPRLALDGSSDTFWVSWGKAVGQGPSPDDPVAFGVDLGAADTVSEVVMHGRSSFGPRTYDVQTSLDGRTWQTVAHVADAPRTGQSTVFGQVKARYVRLSVTRTWQGTNRNVQISGFEVHSSVRPPGDLARYAVMTASSYHTGYPPSAANDGDADFTPWCSGEPGPGWNDNTKHDFPDWLAATWSHPVTIDRVVLTTLDGPSPTCNDPGLRDYDVQVAEDGGWRTVASVRGNTEAVVTSTFPATSTRNLRILVLGTDDGYSRVVEVEAYSN